MNQEVFVSTTPDKKLIIPRKSILLAEVDLIAQIVFLTMSYSKPAVRRHPMEEIYLEPVILGIESNEWESFYRWFTGEELFPAKMVEVSSMNKDSLIREIIDNVSMNEIMTKEHILSCYRPELSSTIEIVLVDCLKYEYLKTVMRMGETVYVLPNYNE
jgi:hypothetical protein